MKMLFQDFICSQNDFLIFSTIGSLLTHFNNRFLFPFLAMTNRKISKIFLRKIELIEEIFGANEENQSSSDRSFVCNLFEYSSLCCSFTFRICEFSVISLVNYYMLKNKQTVDTRKSDSKCPNNLLGFYHTWNSFNQSILFLLLSRQFDEWVGIQRQMVCKKWF